MDKDQLSNSTTFNTITTRNDGFITINYILNTFSLILSLLLMVILIILRIKDINLSNRISLHLILYISIAEIFFSISQMFKFDTRFFSMWNSYFSSWGYIFSTLLICFLIISILINIQLTFIYNYKDIAHIKKYYFIISFSFPIFLSILPITFSQFNFDYGKNYFWYNSVIWEWVTYTGWITLTILYCLFSLIYTLYRLNKNSSQIRLYSFASGTSTTLTTLPETHPQTKMISNYISRIIFYSLIPILAYLPSLISTLASYYSINYSYSLNLFSLVFVSSQSIFTFVIFLFDPVIDEVILEHKRTTDHKKHVLDNIKKGVYVEDIYHIDRELPSNREQNEQNVQQENNKPIKDRKNWSTIYSYARNAKNRISILTTTVLNNKKSVDVKREVFNLDSDENEILSLL